MMPFYILTINNEELFRKIEVKERCSAPTGWALTDALVWLNPSQGYVHRYVEGVQARQKEAKSALVAVEAEPIFLVHVDSFDDPVTVEKARGQIMVDIQGRLLHVGQEMLTELTGEFAYDAFRIVPQDPVPDLQSELTQRAARYIEDKIDEELIPLGHAPDVAMMVETIDESLRSLDDLHTVSYEQLDNCFEQALKRLGEKHFGETER